MLYNEFLSGDHSNVALFFFKKLNLLLNNYLPTV